MTSTATVLDARRPAAGAERGHGVRRVPAVLSAAARIAFLLLAAAALTGEVGRSWWWATAAAVAGLLNLRAAWHIPGRRPGDLLFAVSLVPAELFRWLLTRPAGRLLA